MPAHRCSVVVRLPSEAHSPFLRAGLERMSIAGSRVAVVTWRHPDWGDTQMMSPPLGKVTGEASRPTR